MDADASIRINKYLSECGICSRKAADRFIKQGCVLINGKPAVVGDKVGRVDNVLFNGQAIQPLADEDLVFIALNKPVGIISTAACNKKSNIVDYVNHCSRVFPIGRLDKDSQGLIFLTNKGGLVNKILRTANNHDKEYRVTVNKPVTDEFLVGLSEGVPMLGVVTKKCQVVRESCFVFRITLVQGLNRQIRRMCKHFYYSVEKLERIRIMHIDLEGLPTGAWRNLSQNELSVLLNTLEDSSSLDAARS